MSKSHLASLVLTLLGCHDTQPQVDFARGACKPVNASFCSAGGAIRAANPSVVGSAGRGASAQSSATTAGASAEAGSVAAASNAPGSVSDGTTRTDPNLLVAFLGDQGDNGNSDLVLELVKSEGAAAVVHTGDFDYSNDPPAWNARIDRILGQDFPYFAVVGNHDAPAWDGPNGYASYIAARQSRVPEMDCVGDPGVKATCRFRGLFMVQSCIGSSELSQHGDCGMDSAEQTAFIRDSLASSHSQWSICSWHKTQHDLQVGTKSDEVGWNAYQECLRAGAIINNAHEHSYSRTYVLSDFAERECDFGCIGAPELAEIGPGHTFVFVSGLGGNSVRAFDASHDRDTWWASYYTATRWVENGQERVGFGNFGATFIRFNVMGDERRAWGYFKDINGRIADEFVIVLSEPAP